MVPKLGCKAADRLCSGDACLWWSSRSEVPWIPKTGESKWSLHVCSAHSELARCREAHTLCLLCSSLSSELGTICSSTLRMRDKLCVVGVVTQPVFNAQSCYFLAL